MATVITILGQEGHSEATSELWAGFSHWEMSGAHRLVHKRELWLVLKSFKDHMTVSIISFGINILCFLKLKKNRHFFFIVT